MIEITTIDSPKQTLIYNLTEDKICTILDSTRQEDFYDYLQEVRMPIDYAIIGLNQPQRNTLYALYPQIKISINQHALQKLFWQIGGVDYSFYEEVAATEENEGYDIFLNAQRFIDAFYRQKDKKSAYELYFNWASEVPLGIPFFYRLIRIMEFYKDEIFMYFEMKEFKELNIENSVFV